MARRARCCLGRRPTGRPPWQACRPERRRRAVREPCAQPYCEAHGCAERLHRPARLPPLTTLSVEQPAATVARAPWRRLRRRPLALAAVGLVALDAILAAAG